MDEEKQDELESENQVDGGETGENQTTAKEDGQPDYQKIAEDQRKRAEIAEAKLKQPKDPQSTKPVAAENVDPVEVATLANALQGLTQEEIDFAKTIAAGSKTTLLKALQNEGFQAYHKTIVAEERKKKAALGGSKGSSQETQKSTSDMSREEHMKLAADAAQNIQ